MVLTVCCNPAIDKTARAQRVVNGEVVRLHELRRYAGGKGVNVARILRQYGRRVAVAGFAGGAAGDYLREELRGAGAMDRLTQVAQETRTNLNVIGADGCVTELLEPGPMVSAKELEAFLAEYASALGEADVVALSGSLPEGVPSDLYGRLIRIAHQEGCRVLLDASGAALRSGCEAGPDLVKPNLRELLWLFGQGDAGKAREAALGGDVERDLAMALRGADQLRAMGIAQVVVSMGAQGLLSVSDAGAYHAAAPRVSVANTVGCGDSVVAAYAMLADAAMDAQAKADDEGDAMGAQAQAGGGDAAMDAQAKAGDEGDAMDALRFAVAVSASAATVRESGHVYVALAEALEREVEVRRI